MTKQRLNDHLPRDAIGRRRELAYIEHLLFNIWD